jgi:hypothetical protein
MTHEAAAQYAVRENPCFSVDILRSLRAEADALLGGTVSLTDLERMVG